MYQPFDIRSDLLTLLEANHVSINSTYSDVILEISNRGFSYNSQVMFGMVYTLFKSDFMIAHNLLQNAIDEAKGAARVDLIATKYADSILKEKMKRHVGDELRHSQMFADAIEFTGFSKELDDSDETSQSVEHVFEFDDNLKVFICRVHSIEIRSWTMLRLYIDVLKQRNNPKLNQIIPILEQIKSDELRHVTYTGQQVNIWLAEEPDLKKSLTDCFLHTNRETWHDLANMSNYLADQFNNAVLI